MCGRYSLFNDKEIVDIAQIIQEVESRYGTAVNTGEIYPTNLAPVLIGGDVHPEPARWGFPKFNGSGVIINARAETAVEKPTFKTSLLTRRCAVPTTGFYDWDKDKRKLRFNRPDTPVLWLAGLYNDFAGERRFVILTTAANASMRAVHDRMPVILSADALSAWTSDTDIALSVLQAAQPFLCHSDK